MKKHIEISEHIHFDCYPKQLIFVRHGESEFNKANITVGLTSASQRKYFSNISDQKVSLTGLGVNQATLTGKGLLNANIDFNYAYHSGYNRTKSTLFNILDGLPENIRKNIVIKENFNLRERETGYTLGMTKKEIKDIFPFIDEYFKKTGQFFSRPIGGESICDLYNRIKICLNEIFKETKGKKVLISTHGRVIQVARFILEDDWSLDNIEKFLSNTGPKNCGVTLFNYNKRKNKMFLTDYDRVFYEG